jgi:hypothetical protein
MDGGVTKLVTAAALVTALTAWSMLGLQLGLTLQLMTAQGIGAALWRFLGYFTILTNLGVALVASAMAARPALAGPRVRLATASSILFVALVYSVALRGIWNPTGWQAVADHGLHDVTPLLFLVAWLLAGHGALKWRDALWALVPPLAYCLYAFARGAADGWYAYWFLDPHKLGPLQLAGSIAGLAAAILVIALALTGLDRWLGRRALGQGARLSL